MPTKQETGANESTSQEELLDKLGADQTTAVETSTTECTTSSDDKFRFLDALPD